LKLTQLGLDVDRATCIDNLRRILDTSSKSGFFVRVDMESSAYNRSTLEILETVWNIGYRNVGTVIPVRASSDRLRDIDRLERAGRAHAAGQGRLQASARGRVPAEGPKWTRPSSTSCARSLRAGTYPAIATHDPAMIKATTAFATQQADFEGQIRIPDALRHPPRSAGRTLSAGHPFRVYVPFGKEWFPYFMRRLGERPANVGSWCEVCCVRNSAAAAGRLHPRLRPVPSSRPPARRGQILTSSTFTYSTALCSPAPPGPNSTDRNPAPARMAASVQKDMPVGWGDWPHARAAAIPVGNLCGIEAIGRSVRRHGRLRLKLRVVVAQPCEQYSIFPLDAGGIFAGHGAPLHLQRALVGITAELVAAANDSTRAATRSLEGDRRPRAQLAIARLRARRAPGPSAQSRRVPPPAGCHARAAVRDDVDPANPLCPIAS
jgi:hypothetical protein